MPRSALTDRMQYAMVRLMARLPNGAKIALSGEPPVAIDGQQLDPDVQLLRSIRRRRGFTAILEPSIDAARRRYRRETRIFRGPVTPVASVRDLQIAGPSGPLRVRHYGCESQSLVVYLHGGGFVIGDLDTHDEPCRLLCRHGNTQVLSVAYRLAPEHPFPAAVEDAQAAFQWARAHAPSLGVDPRRVAIGGDSAGANLAGAASLGSEKPFRQLLIYPPADLTRPYPSQQLFGKGFLLSQQDCDTFYNHYAGSGGNKREDPRLSLIEARNLADMPPALMAIAGFDVLRDEGEALARALVAAGAGVRMLRFPSLEHGFIHMTGICSAAREAMLAIAREWKQLIA